MRTVFAHQSRKKNELSNHKWSSKTAMNSLGFSACTQCPAPGTYSKRALGNSSRMSSWCERERYSDFQPPTKRVGPGKTSPSKRGK